MANVSVLFVYLLCCAGAWELMRRNVRSAGEPFGFPRVKAVPFLAIGVIIWILSQASVREFSVAAAVLVVGSVLYFARAALAKR